MRNRVSAFRSRALGQGAVVVLIAGMSAACSNSQRLSEPFFTGSTANQREIIAGTDSGARDYQPMPAQVSSNAVQRSALPPPPSYGAPQTYASADPYYEEPTASREPEQIPAVAYAPPAPVNEAPMLATAGGTYVVQAGDTLFGIARRNGARVADLVALNGLASPESIRIGQTLRLSGDGPMQPTVVASNGPLGAPEKPLGQLRVDANGGALPAGTTAAAEPKIRMPSPADSVAMNPPAMPSIPVETATTATNASVDASIDQAVDAASTDGKSFRWPVRGRIISGFGSKPNGERNDGINLAVPEGTSVKAVEAGTVIYAGNELAGYGNLILIRHADGWVSAYAHNKELLVKRGATIARGQTVAHAGMSGSVTSPQVHFELRKGANPVNPLDYLAGT